MPGRRSSIAAIVWVLLGLVLAGSAAACTCANLPPAEKLRAADAAIVARLVEVVPRSTYEAEFRYEVVRRYKGGRAVAPGTTVAVMSAPFGAACGLPQQTGRHYGLLLARSGGRWRGNSCATAEPRELAVAARRSRDGGGRRPDAERCAN